MHSITSCRDSDISLFYGQICDITNSINKNLTEGCDCTKKTIDSLLMVAVIVPVVLLFWPFAMWNDAMGVILRVIPSFAVQVLLFRIGKWNIIKALPAVLTGVFAAWGIYLYFTSPHWSNATFWGSLIADYVSSFISCIIALIACLLIKKKK